MTLIHIVKEMGGDLYAGGRRASIPAPGHSRHDRSASLMIGQTGKIIAFSFGGASAFEILDDLKGAGLIDSRGFPSGGGRGLARKDLAPDPNRRRMAATLWSAGLSVEGSPSAKYMQNYRAISRNLNAIGAVLHHPAMPIAVYQPESSVTRPAHMSQILEPGGRMTAVEVTYLDRAGDRDPKLRLSRKTIGIVPPGSFVRLDEAAERMIVGEGVMTTLSASEYFGLPAHALLGIRNLRAYRPTSCVRSIIIAADRGPGGEAAAEALRETLISIGVTATVHLPPEQFCDFNQMAQAMRRREKEEGEGSGRVTGR